MNRERLLKLHDNATRYLRYIQLFHSEIQTTNYALLENISDLEDEGLQIYLLSQIRGVQCNAKNILHESEHMFRILEEIEDDVRENPASFDSKQLEDGRKDEIKKIVDYVVDKCITLSYNVDDMIALKKKYARVGKIYSWV